MVDPTLALTSAIDKATEVANTPLFTTVIDRLTGFKISQWSAEGEVRKKMIHDEYEKAKNNGIAGVQFVASLRSVTNLIDIATKSAKHVDPKKTNEIKMDNDFFWNTLEHTKSVSNEEMQELIAKIIAGEYNTPGKYSMSTLQVIKMLGKSELELFEKVCSLLLNSNEIPQSLFSCPENGKELLIELGIDFGSLQLLQSLGLFLPNSMSRSLQNPEKKTFALTYFHQQVLFAPASEHYLILKMPDCFGLSVTGQQILNHLNPQFNEKYFAWIKRNYRIPHYKIAE